MGTVKRFDWNSLLEEQKAFQKVRAFFGAITNHFLANREELSGIAKEFVSNGVGALSTATGKLEKFGVSSASRGESVVGTAKIIFSM